MFADYLATALSMTILSLLYIFAGSYTFPLSIIKWMIIATQNGGLVSSLRGFCCNVKSKPPRFRYKLILELTTTSKISNYNMLEHESKQCSHVSIVMERNGDDLKWIQLSFCGQDCLKIPPALWKMYGGKVKYMDLSYNSIETLKGLEHFGKLEELILDNNQLRDDVVFPRLPYLRTLSLNNNQITDLEGFLDTIGERYPSLTYLSLLSNKACPNQLSDSQKDDSDYQRYRCFVIYKLPSLHFLDSRRVSAAERGEARARGQFMRVRRPPPAPGPPHPPAARAPPRPLPLNLNALGKHKGAYGKSNYTYSGKNSEGNRFIGNSDL